jgi:hypothetical protein
MDESVSTSSTIHGMIFQGFKRISKSTPLEPWHDDGFKYILDRYDRDNDAAKNAEMASAAIKMAEVWNTNVKEHLENCAQINSVKSINADIPRDEDAHIAFATKIYEMQKGDLIGNIEKALTKYRNCEITKCAEPGCNHVSIYLGRDTFVSSDGDRLHYCEDCGYTCSEHNNGCCQSV